MAINENDLMSKGLATCENCEWCVPGEFLPNCLLKNEEKGLFESCELFKKRTGMHISM